MAAAAHRMRTGKMNYIFFLAVVFPGLFTSACSGGKPDGQGERTGKTSPADTVRLVRMTSPSENASGIVNNPLVVSFTAVMKSRQPDSVVVSFSGSQVAVLRNEPWKISVPAAMTAATGRKAVKIKAWKDGRSQSITRFIELKSDRTPPRKSYRVVKTYPHSRDAFTQGLFFSNGLLYEGTGQESGSSLREVELETGKVLRQHNLDASLFGEGITLFGDRIFQVTWENKVGFVYDKASFTVLKKIYYPTQGWGLTTIGDRIVMSDGTNVLSFYEPETFTVASRIEVYDNEGPLNSLNELEFIDGEIWANVWTKDIIARIDPSSGKVLSYVDLRGLLPDRDRNPDTDVLNGIAWDQSTGRIFVTGKKWPKLFEIKVIE